MIFGKEGNAQDLGIMNIQSENYNPLSAEASAMESV